MYHLWLWEAPIDATDKSTNLSFMQVNTANAFILLSAVGRVWLRQHPLYFLHRNCITRHQTCTATIVRSQCAVQYIGLHWVVMTAGPGPYFASAGPWHLPACGSRVPLFSSLHSPSLPSPTFRHLPLLTLPSLPLVVGPEIQLGSLGQRCKLPSMVWGEAPVEIEFGAFYFLALKSDIW